MNTIEQVTATATATATATNNKSATNLSSLDKFLENEKNNNAIEPWSKLDKTVKTKKLLAFAEKYRTEQRMLYMIRILVKSRRSQHFISISRPFILH